MMTDISGAWPFFDSIKDKLEKSVHWVYNNIRPVVTFAENIAEDLRNYDTTNQSEEAVFSSNYFSNYKGVLVIKTPFDASFSFGVIGLSTIQQNADTLKHEYGHTVQLKNMGTSRYIKDVVVPSITINLLNRKKKLPYDYFSYPWEAEANKLGGAALSQEWKPKLPQGGYTSYWDLIPLFFE